MIAARVGALGVALTLVVGISVAAVPASATTTSGVTIVKNRNLAYADDGFFPSWLYPLYKKSGPVVVDSALITVWNNATGALVGAGRTFVKVQPGEYRLTTTVRYRSFRTVGSKSRVVAQTGDMIPVEDNDDTPGLFLSTCAVTSHNGTQDAEPPYDRHGVYSARCTARWGVGLESSAVTGYTNISGVYLGEFDGHSDIYRYQYWYGDTFPNGAAGRGANEFISFSGLPAPASHDISHAFPIRAFSAQKAVKATHIVRRIIR